MTRLVIIGASGRMGLGLVRLLPQFPGLQLSAALASPGSAALGRDSGELAGVAGTGITISANLEAALSGAGLVIDFSSATGCIARLAACAEAGVPLLLGTTGLPSQIEPQIARAAGRIPLLVAANTSLGVAVLTELVRRAAAALPNGFDIEIVDSHHRAKLDAPSGTALALGAAAAAGRNQAPDAIPATHAAGSTAARPVGQIAYAVLRGGDVVGDHDVHFLGAGERLRLSHSATDRSVFGRGALAAGLWLTRQLPGSYRMADVLREK